MKYTELKGKGTKIYEKECYGLGPYTNAYAGKIEYWWIKSNDNIYIHKELKRDLKDIEFKKETYLLYESLKKAAKEENLITYEVNYEFYKLIKKLAE